MDSADSAPRTPPPCRRESPPRWAGCHGQSDSQAFPATLFGIATRFSAHHLDCTLSYAHPLPRPCDRCWFNPPSASRRVCAHWRVVLAWVVCSRINRVTRRDAERFFNHMGKTMPGTGACHIALPYYGRHLFTPFMGAGALCTCIADVRGDNVDHPELDFLGGAIIRSSMRRVFMRRGWVVHQGSASLQPHTLRIPHVLAGRCPDALPARAAIQTDSRGAARGAGTGVAPELIANIADVVPDLGIAEVGPASRLAPAPHVCVAPARIDPEPTHVVVGVADASQIQRPAHTLVVLVHGLGLVAQGGAGAADAHRLTHLAILVGRAAGPPGRRRRVAGLQGVPLPLRAC